MERRKCTLETLHDWEPVFHPGERVFFSGELGSGKSTLCRHIIRKLLGNPELEVPSPTYTYFHQYDWIVHADLYRAESYEDIIQTGLDELFENDDLLFFIEWPEILSAGGVHPTHAFELRSTDIPNERLLLYKGNDEEIDR